MLGVVTDGKPRVFGLDFLRALAIFFVVHGHGRHFLSGTTFDFIVGAPLPHGVDIFFVLSGFLIGRTVLRAADEHAGSAYLRSTFRLYLRTALRILPNYMVLLAANYALVATGVIEGNFDSKPLWRFATLTQNLFTPFYDFFWESWSLPVQWWFYLCFPLLVLLFRRWGGLKAALLSALMVIAASLLYRIHVADQAVDYFWWDVWVRKTVAARSDSIYYGVLAACLCRYAPDLWHRCRWWCLAAGGVLLLAACTIPYEMGSRYVNLLYPSLGPLAFSLMLPALDHWRQAPPALSGITTTVSLLSYSMFLTNLLVVQLLDTHLSAFASRHGVAAYLLFWLVTSLGTLVLYHLIERPAMKLRQRL